MLVSIVKELTGHAKYRQIATLYFSMALGLVVGIATSVINTRFLGAQQYGDYKFLQSLFTFAVTFLTLGIFFSGGRLLAQKKNEGIKQELVGNLLIQSGIISIVFSLIFIIFSFFEEEIFNNNLGGIIRTFAPLLFIYPFRLCLENILQGDSRIYELSAFRLLPQLLYVAGAYIVNYFSPLNLTYALSIQFMVFIVSIIVTSWFLKPKFFNIKINSAQIWQENRRYGLHVYYGTIAGVATAQLGSVLVGYFMDNTNVGYYSLALTITAPLAMIPNAVGTAFFKEFANRDSISPKIIGATIILSTLSLILFCIIIKPLTILLYSEEFLKTVPLSLYLGIGSIFHGFGDFVNRFLGAHGLGHELRNGAFAVGFSNVFGFIVLIYFFGVTGAAATKIFSGIIYFSTMVYYYRVYKRKFVH